MIIMKSNHTEITGTVEEITADLARALYVLINESTKINGKPFTETAEWMITLLTNAVLKANKEAERENI